MNNNKITFYYRENQKENNNILKNINNTRLMLSNSLNEEVVKKLFESIKNYNEEEINKIINSMNLSNDKEKNFLLRVIKLLGEDYKKSNNKNKLGKLEERVKKVCGLIGFNLY
jgi:endonuclease III